MLHRQQSLRCCGNFLLREVPTGPLSVGGQSCAAYQPRHFSIHYQSVRHRQEGIFEQGSTAHQSQPNSEEVLILFMTELSQTLVVYNSVRTYLAGVRHFHVVNSAGNPLQDKLRLQLALAGIRRWKPKGGGTRLPITPLVLRAIKKVLDATSTNYQNILLWAACCVGFFRFM